MECLHAGCLASFQADRAAELAVVHTRTRVLYESIMADHYLQRRWYALSEVVYEAVSEYHQARQEMEVESTEEEDERHQLDAEDSDPDIDPDMDVSESMTMW